VVIISEAVVEDPRLRRATREFLIMVLVGFVLYTIAYWPILITYGSNPRTLIGGVPWWFYLLFVSIAFAIVVVVITYFMKEEPLDPWIKG